MQSKRRRSITIGLLSAAVALSGGAWWLSSQGDRRARGATQSPEPGAPGAAPEDPAAATSQGERPKVDVVFVLDTTGSMGGLLEGAKRKIWAIANQVASGQPRPDVRFGLVGYRDHGDDYVTRVHALTEDMDEIYGHLVGFRAEGGGDTPEHVNQALADALRKMQWRDGDKVLRQIFLVGDAPPHEGLDGLGSEALAKEARTKAIVINAVRCGSSPATERSWTRLAQLSDGAYSSIRQDGAMVAFATAYDDKLAELNDELSRTLMTAGPAHKRKAARRRARLNRAMSPSAKADSAKWRTKTGHLDSADLLTQLEKGKKLAAYAAAELPQELAGRSHKEQRKIVEGLKRKRRALKQAIAKLSKQRDAEIAKKRRAAKRDKSFDDTINEALETQGARVGIAY
jgi:hypothetical protein